MKRNYAADILRIFCCYCIIMLHVSGHLDMNGDFWKVVQGIVRPALWCFMTLSGYFILSRPIVRWLDFYCRHLTRLLVPLILYTFIYQLYYSGSWNISLLPVLAGDSVGHLWFVYSLFALYALAPFLQKMLVNLNNVQFIGLLAIMFFCGRVINIMAAMGFILGIPVSILGDCSLFFFLYGYGLSRINGNISYKILLPIGIVNVTYCAYTFSNPVLVNSAANLSAGMATGVFVYYMFFNKFFAHVKKKWEKAITFVSARTYGIYLIHMLIFQYFTSKEILVLEPYSHTHIWMLPFKSFIIFMTGFVFATIMDLIICNPIQKAICRIFDLVNHRNTLKKDL